MIYINPPGSMFSILLLSNSKTLEQRYRGKIVEFTVKHSPVRKTDRKEETKFQLRYGKSAGDLLKADLT